MRPAAFLFILFFLASGVTQAQGLMRMYRMTYSVSGMYENGSTSVEIDQPTGTAGSELDLETVRLSTRNGYFLTRNFVLGFEFQWEQNSAENRPRPNLSGYRYESFDRRLFFGPLVRWYQPMSVRWFVYPELSFGYTHFLGETEEVSANINALPATTSARGFAFHAGAGFGYFLTRHLVFDASARYMHAWAQGEYALPGQPDRNVDLEDSHLELLIGFQVLI